jgi:hypothetical protein
MLVHHEHRRACDYRCMHGLRWVAADLYSNPNITQCHKWGKPTERYIVCNSRQLQVMVLVIKADKARHLRRRGRLNWPATALDMRQASRGSLEATGDASCMPSGSPVPSTASALYPFACTALLVAWVPAPCKCTGRPVLHEKIFCPEVLIVGLFGDY